MGVHGVTQRKWSDEDKERLQKMWNTGAYTHVELGIEFDRTANSISAMIKQLVRGGGRRSKPIMTLLDEDTPGSSHCEQAKFWRKAKENDAEFQACMLREGILPRVDKTPGTTAPVSIHGSSTPFTKNTLG